MSELVVFEEREVLGKEFKMYGSAAQPLFLAKDVAAWIEHSNPTVMLAKIDEDEKQLILCELNNVYSTSRARKTQEQWFLTEDGLYEVLMQSRKPIAKDFKKEVKAILKQIRLTGGTVITGREEEFISNYFPSFSEDVKKAMVLDLHKKNEEYKATIEKQKEENKILQVKNKVLSSENLEWEDRKIIESLIKRLGTCIGYSYAWGNFKKELLYNHGININSRITNQFNSTGRKPTTLDVLHHSEFTKALKTILSLCEEKAVEIDDLVCKINAA